MGAPGHSPRICVICIKWRKENEVEKKNRSAPRELHPCGSGRWLKGGLCGCPKCKLAEERQGELF